VVDQYNIHVKDLFAKETALKVYDGLKVTLTVTKQVGKIEGTFGKSGKIKVRFDTPITEDVVGSQCELYYKKNMMKKQANKFK
jgi:ribosomal protein L35AE/L33A